MITKNINLNVNCENIGFLLNLPVNVEIDYWTSKAYRPYIFFRDGEVDDIQIKITWRIEKEDITDSQEIMLFREHDCFDTGRAIEGDIYINSQMQKGWNILLNTRYIETPLEVTIDFLDNIIEIA